MAIAVVSSRGTTAYVTMPTTGNNFPLTSAATIAVGNTLVMFGAIDNSGPNGVGQIVQVADPRGNIWSPLVNFTNDPGAADAGVQLVMWICQVQYAYQVGDVLEISPAESTNRGVLAAYELSGVRRINAAVTGAAAIGTGTTATAPALAVLTTGHLALGMAAIESNAVVTGDADITDGAWVGMANSSSNSGTAATSVRVFSESKITTGTSTQNWAATWTGSADWVAASITIGFANDPATPEDYPQDNPNYPCLAGPELLPTESVSLPIDTGTGYSVLFESLQGTENSVDMHSMATFVEPTGSCQHVAAFEWTTTEAFLASQDEVIDTLVLPLRRVDLGTGTADPDPVVIGGGTALAALSSHGGSYVYFDIPPNDSTNDSWVNLWFDPAELVNNYANGRIYRIGLRYKAWKDDSAPDIPGEGFDVIWTDSVTFRSLGAQAATMTYGSWLTPDYRNRAKYQMRWLGETNWIPRNMFSDVTQDYNEWELLPFSVNDLAAMASGDESNWIRMHARQGFDLLQTAVYLDHVEMVVEVSRQGFPGLVSNRALSTIIEGYEFDGSKLTQMRSLNGFQRFFQPALEGFFSVREAHPATSSDRYRANPDGSAYWIAKPEAIGPSLELPGVRSLRSFFPGEGEYPVTYLTAFDKGRILSADPDHVRHAASMIDPGIIALSGPQWVDAIQLSPPGFQYVENTTPNTVEIIIETDGATEYARIRVMLRPSIASNIINDLTLTLTNHPAGTPLTTATITGEMWQEVADFYQYEDLVYLPVIAVLDAPITPAGKVRVVASSSAPVLGSWQISSWDSYAAVTAYQWREEDPTLDKTPAITLLCALPAPDVSIETVTYYLPNPEGCVDTSLQVPKLTIANTGDFDRFVIERSVNLNFWDVVVTNLPASQADQWIDIGVPWDFDDVEYRVTGWRDADRRNSSIEIEWPGAPAPAPGSSPLGIVAYFPSGQGRDLFQRPSHLLVYTPGYTGEPEMSWVSLNPTDELQLHGKDFQTAIRGREQRGLQMTTNLVVANFDLCPCLDSSSVIAYEDFEDTNYTIEWAGDWDRSNTEAHTGTWSLQADTISDDQSATVTIQIPAGAGYVNMWLKVDSEAGFDFLTVAVDGLTLLSVSGDVDWTEHLFNLPTPAYELTLTYSKDASASSGADSAWLDDLTFYRDVFEVVVSDRLCGPNSTSVVPFAPLRIAENSARVVLLLPGAASRDMALTLGGMSVKTAHGIYMAETTFTDITSQSSYPYTPYYEDFS